MSLLRSFQGSGRRWEASEQTAVDAWLVERSSGRGFACARELARLYTWNWIACTRDTSSCSVALGGWCRDWYVAVWRCVAGAAPVWHVVAGDWRCVAGAAPVWHLAAGDWSILVALERGSGWLVQGMVRCSVTLRGRRSTSVTCGGRWLTLRGRRSTSVTFGGRWLKHPGSVGAWLWVAGAGNGTLQCDVAWQAQQQCEIWWQVIEASW